MLECLLPRLDVVSGSVTTFSSPFSLTDLFHNNKELDLRFQRQKGVGKGLRAWSGHTEALSSQARPISVLRTPRAPAPPNRPLSTPHGSHTTGATSRGASSLVSSRLGVWTDTLFKALQVRQGLLWFHWEGWYASLNVTADASGGGGVGGSPCWISEGKARDPLKEPAWSQGKGAHSRGQPGARARWWRERRWWEVGGWGGPLR